MFFFYLLSLLANRNSRYERQQTKFLENLSLIPPHVGANGREDFFDFDNDFVVKAMSRRDFTQLGYKAENSFGIVKTKESFKFREMEIMLDFTLHNVEKAGKFAGFGFWLTEKAENKPEFYGCSTNYNGCGVIVDISGTPYIKYIDSKNLSNKNTRGVPIPSAENETYRIIFTASGKNFKVRLFVSDKETLLYEGPVVLPEKVFISATSFSGKSKTTMHLERIFSSGFVGTVKKPVVRGERKGSNFYIYVLGVASILGLVYYIYNKESKEMIFKN